MCLYPRLIRNKKYLPNKKNKGLLPDISDVRALVVPVGCGRCIECLKQKARNWSIRLQEEIRDNAAATFITLTFSNEAIAMIGQNIDFKGYERDNQIATVAVRRFLERWRKTHKRALNTGL